MQELLLEKILGGYTKRAEAVEALAKVLNLGNDAIYRRLRGDSLLTPDEIELLAKTYRVSLDELVFPKTDAVFFSFNAFSNSIEHVDHYLTAVLQNLGQLMTLQNASIYYAACEIPVFYYCVLPNIIRFKLYVWGRTVWNLPQFQQVQFNHSLFSPDTMAMCDEIQERYRQLPTIELWNMNLFDTTLNQIEYMYHSGLFDKLETALQLCDELLELVEHMRLMANSGSKVKFRQAANTGAAFDLYHNEMFYTTNTIYIKHEMMQLVFLTFSSPNFIHSKDSRIAEYTDKWFDTVTKRSVSITGHSERNRNWFFNGLKRRVEASRQRIDFSANN